MKSKDEKKELKRIKKEYKKNYHLVELNKKIYRLCYNFECWEKYKHLVDLFEEEYKDKNGDSLGFIVLYSLKRNNLKLCGFFDGTKKEIQAKYYKVCQQLNEWGIYYF